MNPRGRSCSAIKAVKIAVSRSSGKGLGPRRDCLTCCRSRQSCDRLEIKDKVLTFVLAPILALLGVRPFLVPPPFFRFFASAPLPKRRASVRGGLKLAKNDARRINLANLDRCGIRDCGTGTIWLESCENSSRGKKGRRQVGREENSLMAVINASRERLVRSSIISLSTTTSCPSSVTLRKRDAYAVHKGQSEWAIRSRAVGEG